MQFQKHIPGYENLYIADKFGSIIDVSTGDTLPGKKGKMGMRIYLEKDGCKRLHFVHDLIAKTWLEKRPTGTSLHHVDKNRYNNHVSNLRWDKKLKWSKLTSLEMKEIVDKHNNLKLSIRQLGKLYNVHYSTISRAIKRVREGIVK